MVISNATAFRQSSATVPGYFQLPGWNAVSSCRQHKPRTMICCSRITANLAWLIAAKIQCNRCSLFARSGWRSVTPRWGYSDKQWSYHDKRVATIKELSAQRRFAIKPDYSTIINSTCRYLYVLFSRSYSWIAQWPSPLRLIYWLTTAKRLVRNTLQRRVYGSIQQHAVLL